MLKRFKCAVVYEKSKDYWNYNELSGLSRYFVEFKTKIHK